MDPRERTLWWIRETVVGLDLCPFAREPLARGAVRVTVSEAKELDECVRAALAELARLDAHPEVETTLVVFPDALRALDDLLDAATAVEHLIEEAGFAGVVQVVSFHPDYRFEGAPEGDLAAWTNRSPYPMLHLLREASVAEAVDRHPDPASIPARNVERLRAMSLEELRRRRDG